MSAKRDEADLAIFQAKLALIELEDAVGGRWILGRHSPDLVDDLQKRVDVCRRQATDAINRLHELAIDPVQVWVQLPQKVTQ